MPISRMVPRVRGHVGYNLLGSDAVNVTHYPEVWVFGVKLTRNAQTAEVVSAGCSERVVAHPEVSFCGTINWDV